MHAERKLAKTIFSGCRNKITPRYRKIVENGKKLYMIVSVDLHNDVNIKVCHNYQKQTFWLKKLEIL